MGRIVVSENITLDGVIQDPSGDEGFERGGWVGKVTDREEAGKVLAEETLAAEVELYGRRTYEFLASRWPSREGALADRLNAMPKYVISSSLEDPEWTNTTVLKGDAVEQVSKLKEEVDGEILVPASIKLVRTLLEHDLVDELRLLVYPVVLGAGERLFSETSEAKGLRLVDTRTVDDLALLTYRVA
jgi:dihydrofolate reductase